MDYLSAVLEAVADEERFVRLTLSGPRGRGAEWLKVVVRPVEVRGGRRLQAVLQGRRKRHAASVNPPEAAERIREWVGMGFRHLHVQCTDRDLHIRLTSKGRALVKVGEPSVTQLPALPKHDREKHHALPASAGDDFLEAAGIMRQGKIRSSMRDKFRQVNHFLELLGHTRVVRERQGDLLRILDCGCGRALLTFAACHYLRDVLGFSVRATGVDADGEVIASAERLRERVGEGDVKIVRARICDYAPEARPNIVLSLHACDTATDEALALGVRAGADLIMAAPCCQHELHRRIARPEFRAVLRHGILRERTADILTDALRAAALRVMGYRTDVIEFVSPGHTAKNLMIRAEKGRGMRKSDAAREYLALRDFWSVTPAVEAMLGAEFARALG